MSSIEANPELINAAPGSLLRTPTAVYSLKKVNSDQEARELISEHSPTEWRIISAPSAQYLLCSFPVSA
jgi:hypothetical protein